MPLAPGTTLGPYAVTAKIGEGGMGEVYRARDTKLDRDVALKVLPQAFTSDSDRLARFEREAKVLASLNHPNIGGIYGLEESAGIRALVLEYIEGPTLADRIKQGPIPIDEALPIANQIAEALEAAHDAGVIHRDLKPANIKVKPDGVVKVLDFGLAKALEGDTGSDPSESPTLTAAATQQGIIMGTAAYMAPEQAAGQVADKRSDIWSFGVVLFEMLTGQRLFTGETISHVLAKVLERELDMSVLPTPTPAPVKRLLRRCLERKPKRRLSDVGEALSHLEEAATTRAEEPTEHVVPSGTQPAGWRTALPWAAAVVFAGIAGVAVLMPVPPTAKAATRFTIELPQGVQFGPLNVVSPDGRTVALQGIIGNNSYVYLRSLDNLESIPLRGAENAAPAFAFSPDGESLLILDAGPEGGAPHFTSSASDVRRIALTGGTSTPVTEGNGGTAWGPDDVFVRGTRNGLQLVSTSGGEATSLTIPTDAEVGHYFPRFLPSGRAVLFYVWTGDEADAQVAVYDFETGQRTDLLAGTSPSFATTGHLVFWRDGSLWAVSFDQDRLRLRGDPVVVMENVAMIGLGLALYDLAENGTLVYTPDVTGIDTIGWVSRQGVMSTPLIDGETLSLPRLSPDGTRVAFRRQSDAGGLDIVLRDLTRGTETRLTDTATVEDLLIWSPDGETVTFLTNVGLSTRYDLYSRPVDLSAESQVVIETPGADTAYSIPGSWSPDGQTLVYTTSESGLTSDKDLWVRGSDGESTPLLATEFAEAGARLSPNGKWMSYVSNQAGTFRVFVQAFPEGGEVYSISTGPSLEAVWSRDGRELFYRNVDEMWVVDVETESEFRVGRPRLIFEASFLADPFNKEILTTTCRSMGNSS